MIRKLLMVAAVAIVPFGAVAATGSIAGAAVNEAGTATCGATTGTLSFSTPVSNAGVTLAAGKSFTQTTTVTATLTKCVKTGGGLTITKGSVKGTVKDTTEHHDKVREGGNVRWTGRGIDRGCCQPDDDLDGQHGDQPDSEQLHHSEGWICQDRRQYVRDLRAPGHGSRKQGRLRLLPRHQHGQGGQVQRPDRQACGCDRYRLREAAEDARHHHQHGTFGHFRLSRRPPPESSGTPYRRGRGFGPVLVASVQSPPARHGSGRDLGLRAGGAGPVRPRKERGISAPTLHRSGGSTR